MTASLKHIHHLQLSYAFVNFSVRGNLNKLGHTEMCASVALYNKHRLEITPRYTA